MRPNTLIKGLYILFSIFFWSNNYAQQNPCAADFIHKQMKAADPFYQKQLSEDEAKLQAYLEKQKKGDGAEKSSGTYTIPVVVHVVYTSSTATNNISDAQIQSAITRLNDIYSNATGSSLNTGIQFKLATMDENCNATTGILRVSGAGVTNYSSHGIDNEVTDSDGVGASLTSVFNLSRWDPDLYMNVYIVSEIANNDGGYGTQGYAFYPSTSDTYYGIVLLYNTFGYDYNNCGCYQLKSYTNQNETFAHEVGHYLNLKHTFEGGSSSTCPSTDDTAGDGVADTPAHKYITYCPTSGNNTCYASSHAFYSWDKIKYNLMGYFTETCTDEFTQGQVDRMLATIETTRPYLVNSPGLQTANATIATSANCSPQSTTGLGGEYGTGITYVKINDLEASSDGTYEDGGYLQRNCFSTTLEPGQTYDVAVKTWGYYNEDVRVYIDYDNNGSFASSEQVFSGDNGTSFTGTFTVPTTSSQGVWVRARVISDVASNTISGGCYAPKYGQVEDYPVFISALNPTLTVSVTSLSSFVTHSSAASVAQNFKVSATDVVSTISIMSSSTAFELSTDGTNYAASLSLSPSSLSLAETTIYVRVKSGQTAGSYSGTLTVAHSGATSKTVSVSGTVGSISTERGKALDLDGGHLSSTLLATNGSQPFTIESWLKIEGSSIVQGIMHKSLSQSDVTLVAVAIKQKLYLLFANKRMGVGKEPVISYGDWHHFAFTWDGTICRLYLDGVEAWSETATLNYPNEAALKIGAFNGGKYPMYGKVEELRIWETSRTQAQIVENMHLSAAAKSSSGVAYYQFNKDTKDENGLNELSLEGTASYVSSGANMGETGGYESKLGINTTGSYSFAAAKLEMDITAVSGALNLTAVYQAFAPNTTEGVSGSTTYDAQTWTLHETNGIGFTTDLTFILPTGTISDLTTGAYQLYHRQAGSEGSWSLLVDGAASVSGSKVEFEGIDKGGQFMLGYLAE